MPFEAVYREQGKRFEETADFSEIFFCAVIEQNSAPSTAPPKTCLTAPYSDFNIHNQISFFDVPEKFKKTSAA